MEKRKVLLLIAATAAALALAFFAWCMPGRQVRRAQDRLIAAMESRDFDAMADLVAADYRDRWEHDKAIVLSRSREVFGQFVLLTIERREDLTFGAGNEWTVSEKIHIKGLGGPLAIIARDRVNTLDEPFEMTWRKRSWKPWDWELTRVEHPTLKVR